MSLATIAVPYTDLRQQHAAIKPELMAAVSEVIDSAKFVLGEPVDRFEQQFAKLCSVPFAIGVASGTDALILALRALGVGPSDEVITAPNSFVASTSCIRLVGATPVFIDVGSDLNIDPDRIEAAITPRTKAIIPVHLTGRPCRMDLINDIARRRGLAIVEDAAQAITAEYGGQRVGSFGAIGCFSLHPLKTLSACGEAGALTTADPELNDRLRTMRNIGLRTRDDCVMWSGNSRLDTLHAAMLLVKMKHLDRWTERRQANARFYRERLCQVGGVTVPVDGPGERAVYHTFVVQVDDRERLREHLSKRAIGTAIHYPVPIHLSAAGHDLGYPRGAFPVAERQAARILSLPIHQDLTVEQLETVCSAIADFYAAN